MGRIRQRLTFANVISVIALFVALGGGAYAVSVAKKNSVVSKSIKNGQVKTNDLAKSAVNGAKVANNSLKGADINESSLGAIPLAAHASSADNATNATQLGGAPASSYQSRVGGNCGTAISSVAANGSVGCAQGTVIPIRLNTGAGTTKTQTIGSMQLLDICRNPNPATTELEFRKLGNTTGSLNWVFTNLSNTQASGGSTPPGDISDFTFAANRIEGQFIWSDPLDGSGQITTVSIHAADTAGACEVVGTAEDAPVSG